METCSKPSFKQIALKKKKKESRLLRKKNSRAGNLYFGDAYKFVSFSSKRQSSLLSLHHVALKKDTK